MARIKSIIFLALLLWALAPAAVFAADPALTVTDVLVDKTADNAVIARDQAIAEAKRSAFQKLAQQSMSPESFKTFTLPSDNDISALVQDFEIVSEQLSATRYVANFTVRFREVAKNYLPNHPLQQAATAPVLTPPGGTLVLKPPPGMVAAAASPVAHNILVLPYYENIAGKTLLWEDGNPWLAAWQATPPAAEGWTVSVPLGDIGDISAGSSDAVWSGDNSAVEKLRRAYNADAVVLAVANKSGPALVIDIYIYHDGKVERKQSLTPYIGATDDAQVFAEGAREVLAFLQKPGASLPAAAPPLAGDDMETADTPVAVALPETATVLPATASATTIEAEMAFDTFAQWVEVQKRLSSVTPPVALEIRNITSSSAGFTLTFPGDIEALKTALAGRGVVLGQAVVAVGESIPGSAQPTQTPVYSLQLVN